MSTYSNGRRAPNVSQYIANLNTIPTPQDLAAQNEFDLAGDGLDFLNTEFFDFDASTFDANGNFAPDPLLQQQSPANGDNFQQYTGFQQYPQAAQFSQSPTSIANTSSAATFPQDFAVVGNKRTADVAQLQPVGDLEDQSKVAAEEDKRRRNTAASARFRVKKKQREAALETQAKEMTDKVQALENKVQQLEMENKWLKGLITEKSDVKSMEEQFQKYAKEKQLETTSSTATRTVGVGTKVDGADA